MRTVEMIPVRDIHVLNPRARNRTQHREIIDNIERIGLKRPITVSRRTSARNGAIYDLVCGQGRLEAFTALGNETIPAFVIDAPEQECLIMSLVENIARRQHRPLELMHEIGALSQRGYTDTQIAEKTGVTAQWAGMIVDLLQKGEERLVAAVESGVLPVSLATEIARLDDPSIQLALADAYSQGKLKGKKLTLVRRLLEQRAQRGKSERTEKQTRSTTGGSRKVTSEQMVRLYQREVEKQRLIAKKAEYTHSRLLFVVEALRNLVQDSAFVALLRAEGVETLPRALGERMLRGVAA